MCRCRRTGEILERDGVGQHLAGRVERGEHSPVPADLFGGTSDAPFSGRVDLPSVAAEAAVMKPAAKTVASKAERNMKTCPLARGPMSGAS